MPCSYWYDSANKPRLLYNYAMSSYKTILTPCTAEIEEKKSRFIAHLFPVQTEEEALTFLEEVRSEHRMARHNVYAYIIRAENSTERVRYSDDGEPQKTAGLPCLDTLRHAQVSNIAVVVTRYFGGTLLGTGGLVRAYTQATQTALEQAEIVTISRCVDITITLPYALHDQILHIAQECGAKVVSTEYTDAVTVVLRMIDGTQAPLLSKLQEIFRGEEPLHVSAPYDAAF